MSFFQPTSAAAARKAQQRPASTTSKQDSDHRHLLSPSAAPSRAESIRSFGASTSGDADAADSNSASTAPPLPRGSAGPPRSQSAPAAARPYRGYASEDEYIAAFAAFLREKQYFESEQQLTGFYGAETLADYAARGGQGPFAKSKAQRVREKERRRKEAVGATLDDVAEAEEERARGGEDVDATVPEARAGGRGAPSGLRRMGMGFGRVFTRRGTVA